MKKKTISKNTKPEKLIRSKLYENGYRFRIHVKKLPGKPDIVLHKHKTILNGDNTRSIYLISKLFIVV